jgi:hypothetical protein
MKLRLTTDDYNRAIVPKCRICGKLMEIVEASPNAFCQTCGRPLVYGYTKHWHCNCGQWAHYPGGCDPKQAA